MQKSFDAAILTDDNPFGVQVEQVVGSGELNLVGYHDNQEEGYISASFNWFIGEVEGIAPLLAGALGSMCFAWRDAMIPLNGSTTGAKGRVQGVVSVHECIPMNLFTPMRPPVPMVGIFQGSQGFMPLSASEGNFPRLHPTLVRFLQLITPNWED
jgi:hypothetical protein